MKCLSRFLSFAILCLLSSAAFAQNWKQVLKLPNTIASSGFFLNASLGWIGTGLYQSSMPAEIFRTSDAGATWIGCMLPAIRLKGQVTDIFFSSPTDGWATIRESVETGWSGVYHSTDGGTTWKFNVQASFPAAVRVTSRGVFYTDRDQDPGVKFSSDNGKTWTLSASTVSALSVDFMDDLNGFVTSQAYGSGPHLITTDGGRNWSTVTTRSESWTAFGDAKSKTFLFASERDFGGGNAVYQTPIVSAAESSILTYGGNSLTGGINGYRGCQSVIYVQQHVASGNAVGGLIRSTNSGTSWSSVGGPSNRIDTRFAVTGRGAVVFAFDSVGGVWKTSSGGDGTRSFSVLNDLSIIAENVQTQAQVCDSALVKLDLRYNACDSVRISRMVFPDDQFGELSYVPLNSYIAGASSPPASIVFRPTSVRSWTAKVLITIRQLDGFEEDTIITINLNGLPRTAPSLNYKGLSAQKVFSFDSVSLCTGGLQEITILNASCNDVRIYSLLTTAPFSIASRAQPFTLSAGGERTFLLGYNPAIAKTDNGYLIVNTDASRDSIPLIATAYNPTNALPFTISAISAPLCDSTNFQITYRNIQCVPIRVVDAQTFTNFRLADPLSTDSVPVGASGTITLRFVATVPGSVTDSIRLHFIRQSGAQFDTTLLLTATATTGKPGLTLSAPVLNFGNVSLCGSADDTLIVQSTGCGPLTFNAAIGDSTKGFTIVRNTASNIPAHTADTIIVHFKSIQPGQASTSILIVSGAGAKTIPITASVTSDAGSAKLTITQNIQSLTCNSSTFSFEIANNTCDSLTIKGVIIGGNDSLDYLLGPPSKSRLAAGDVATIDGSFSPTAAQVRRATIFVHMLRRNGQPYDTTLNISGVGLPVPPIPIVLTNTHYHAPVSGTVEIPILALAPSTTRAENFSFALGFKTDLLTPLNIQTAVGQFGGASISSFNVYKDSVAISLSLPADQDITAGELWSLRCKAFVTDSLTTSVSLLRASFSNAANSYKCLTTQSLQDSATIFTLDTACGNGTISRYMANPGLLFDRIVPNPSTGNVQISFIANDYGNDGVLEVYDALGTKIHEERIFAERRDARPVITLSLDGASGVRYLRLVNSNGVTTRMIILRR